MIDPNAENAPEPMDYPEAKPYVDEILNRSTAGIVCTLFKNGTSSLRWKELGDYRKTIGLTFIALRDIYAAFEDRDPGSFTDPVSPQEADENAPLQGEKPPAQEYTPEELSIGQLIGALENADAYVVAVELEPSHGAAEHYIMFNGTYTQTAGMTGLVMQKLLRAAPRRLQLEVDDEPPVESGHWDLAVGCEGRDFRMVVSQPLSVVEQVGYLVDLTQSVIPDEQT